MKCVGKILVLLLLSSGAWRGGAQEDSMIRRLLVSGNAAHFYAYAARFEDSPTSRCAIYLLDRREVAPGFEEATATFHYYVKVTDTPHITQRMYGYDIALLAQGNSIVYYHLTDVEAEDGVRMLTPNYFADQRWMDTLRHRYQKMFTVGLDTTKLFCAYGIQDDDEPMMVYAAGCGFGNQPPELREKMEQAIRQGNRKLMFSWLTQPNTEMQLYAVEAYHRMRRKWVANKDERRIIQYIRKKEGTVVTCSGCMVGESLSIKEACRKFDFGW